MSRCFLVLFLILHFLSSSLAQVKTLDFFIQAGLSNSPLIHDLNNQQRMNSVDSLLVRANRLPQVRFNGLMMYAPVINNWGYSEAITNGGNLISTINVSQTIFNNKNIEAKFKTIGLQNQSVGNSTRLSEKELKKTITDQYLSAYSLSNEIDFETALLKSGQNEDSILKRMVEKGVYRQTDYLTFLLELQQIELDLNDFQIQYQGELAKLHQICGISSISQDKLVVPVLAKPVTLPENSPFFYRFTIDSLQIMHEKTLIDRNYKPTVTWMSDAGLVNNDPSVIYKNLGFSLGMSLTLPIFDGNQRKLNYTKLKLAEETRKGYEDFFRKQYDQQLRQLNNELSRIQGMIPKLIQQLATAESIIKLDRDLMNNGAISVTDFVIAVRNLVKFRNNLNKYQVKELRIINEINYWE